MDSKLLDPLALAAQFRDMDLRDVVDRLRSIHAATQHTPGAPTQTTPKPSRPSYADLHRAVQEREQRYRVRQRRDARFRDESHDTAPLHGELRLLLAGDRAAGRFVLLNERTSELTPNFVVHAPHDVASSAWSRTTVSISPSDHTLAPRTRHVFRLAIDVSELVDPPGFEFAVDIRDHDDALVQKLWVEVVVA